MKIVSHSLTDTEKFAEKFLQTLPRKETGATVVGLYGDLGSGKTTFVQAIGRALGIKDSIQSPTFVIIKSYKLKANSYKLLVHIDAYRLKSGEELCKLGFEELLVEPHNLILVEWADKVADILPKNHRTLNFKFVDETTREFSIK